LPWKICMRAVLRKKGTTQNYVFFKTRSATYDWVIKYSYSLLQLKPPGADSGL